MFFITLMLNGFVLNAVEIQPKGIEKAENEGELEIEHKIITVYQAANT